jgi:acyl-CoA reductase-like NAD-dependent aldehyde dehydrogenase
MTDNERKAIVATWPDWKREDFEERAGIIQYVGVTSRERAEQFAFEMVKDRKEPALK